MRRIALAFILLAGLARPAQAGMDEADAAYNRGDFETTYAELRPIAEGGDARAQILLGILYEYGSGVPRDDAEAVRWYRLAAEQGSANAIQYGTAV